MTPYMTEDVIRREYRDAKDKPAKIKILAQLCDTDESYIKAVVGLISETKDPPQKMPGEKGYVDYDKVDRLLRKKGLTDKDVAMFMGCSRALISRYCRAHIDRYPHRRDKR